MKNQASIYSSSLENDPELSIADFFSTFNVEEAHQIIEDIFIAAHSTNLYKKGQPRDVLVFAKLFGSLIEAGLELHLTFESNPENRKRKARSRVAVCDLKISPLRYLSAEESGNPYQVLRGIFTDEMAGWTYDMKEIFEHALTTSQLQTTESCVNPFRLFLAINKLIDTAYVLHTCNVVRSALDADKTLPTMEV
ncbi:hypothetical protein [Chitinophaga sp. YIM B06452]|uniref:hypothetical protein n=1 Tax=Chitinophaga sp. YIM B06452 TaxID=3082158 RepID=UPI0031FE8C0B